MMFRRTFIPFLLFSYPLLAGCSGHRSEPIHVDFSRREVISDQGRDGDERAALRFAVSAMTSPARTFSDYRDLVKYIGQKVDRPVTFKQRRTYQEINNMLRDGDLDVALICSGAYVRLKQEVDISLIAAPVIDGRPFYRSYIIARRDSPIGVFGDLRDRRFAFTDPMSNTGKLYPTYRVMRMGWTPERFFGHLIYTYSHDLSIQAVAQGIVDGAAVDGLIYDHLRGTDAGRVAALKVIEQSEPFGAPPIVAGPYLSADVRASLQECILHMADDPAGAAILRRLRVDRFVAGDDRDYDGIRKMLKCVEGIP